MYIRVFATLALVIPGVIAAINIAIDPYSFFGTKMAPGFNVMKPELANHEKELKVHRLTTLRPDGLILGSSASAVGFDPEHPGWSAETVYSLGVGRSSISLAHHFLLHAMEFQTPKQVVLGLELGMFNPTLQTAQGINPAAFAVTKDGKRNREYLALNYFATAFSLDMLASSFTTFAVNRKNPVLPSDHRPQISAVGMINPESSPVNRWKTFRNRFQAMVAVHVDRFWAPLDRFNAIEEFSDDPTFKVFQDIVRLACENEIELYIVFSPTHAYLLEAQEAAGLTELWERWQKAVVYGTVNRPDGPGCKSISVWDFSGYNEFTTEIIAESNDASDAPQGYWDPVHYRKWLGDIMLNRVFDVENMANPNDFGVMLTPDNIDGHIAATRERAVQYRNSHPEEVSLVNETVKATLKTESK